MSRILTPTLLIATLCQPTLAQNGEDRDHIPKTFRKDSLEAVRLARTIDSLYQHEMYDEALALIDKSIAFFEQLGLINQVTHALIRKGGIYRSNGDYARALGLFTIALDNYRNLGDRKGEASVMNHIGAVFRLQGNYPTALEYYFKALTGYQAIDYKPGISSILNNIGIVYQYQKDYDKALDYYTRSLRIEEELGDEEGIGISNLNIGGIYQKKKEYQRAIDYYLKALVYAKKENDPDAIGVLYNEIGAIYIERGNLSEVKDFLDKAHRAFTGLGSKFRIAECELNYGKYFAAMRDTREAIRHFEQALTLSKETGSMEICMEAHRNLSLIHETLNRPHEALNHFKAYIAARDSIHNDENTKKSVQAEMLYQFERQQEQMRIEQAKRDAQMAEKVQRQRVFRNLLLVILLLAVVLIGYVLASNRTKQRINAQLELQQKEILEKNEELLQQQEEILAQRDEIEKKNLVLERSRQIIVSKNERMVSSIEYAQTIQQAILPSEDVFKKSFTDYFIIYMPKDIVSGDFYWVNKINHLLFAAVIDCTGHGVPGSFMSMIGNTLLNQIVNEWQTYDPALILEYLHQKVRQALKQDEKHSKSHASMDIAITVIDTKKKRGVFAGASRPLYYIQGDKLTRIQGDPRSVGGFQRENKRYFSNHDIDLSKPTCIYLATDGYVDQLNPERRKFGTLPFTQLLTANHKKSMDVQRAILESEFQKHRHGEEQIDDVCILGLRI